MYMVWKLYEFCLVKLMSMSRGCFFISSFGGVVNMNNPIYLCFRFCYNFCYYNHYIIVISMTNGSIINIIINIISIVDIIGSVITVNSISIIIIITITIYIYIYIYHTEWQDASKRKLKVPWFGIRRNLTLSKLTIAWATVLTARHFNFKLTFRGFATSVDLRFNPPLIIPTCCQ